MSLTPLDILHKEFKRSFRGLREREVSEFLREVAGAFEDALAANADLRDKVQSLERRLLHYEKIEETMQNALVLAQKSAEETRLGSQKQAEVILADAEQKRKQILDEARARGQTIEREYAELRQQRRLFETEFRALLHAHLQALERSPSSAVEAEAETVATDAPDPQLFPAPELDEEEEQSLSALDWTRLEQEQESASGDSTGRPEPPPERALLGTNAFST